MNLIPVHRRQRQVILYVSEASLIYRVSSQDSQGSIEKPHLRKAKEKEKRKM